VCLYLIEGGVQGEELTVAVGLALLLVVAVYLLIGGPVKQVGQDGVRDRVLQVKDTTGPTATRGVIYGHGPTLQIILEDDRKTKVRD
jgi:hypothetical protein